MFFRLHVDDGAEAAADQALDLLRAAGLLALRGFALGARAGGARQHGPNRPRSSLRRNRWPDRQ